jgi:hypothetical protein
MYFTAARFLSLSGALITLTLMIYMARPWGDNYAYQSLSGYAWLLGLAVWATLPYLMILYLARKVSESKANILMVALGALIISFSGVTLYMDASFLRPDPQGGLVFFAVPCYQWIIIGLLTGILFLFRKKQAS